MSRRHKLKARNRITQRMTRDGLVKRNETTGYDENISKRSVELDLNNPARDNGARGLEVKDARSVRQGYSQVGNKSSKKSKKRAKNLYHQSYESKNTEFYANPLVSNTHNKETLIDDPQRETAEGSRYESASALKEMTSLTNDSKNVAQHSGVDIVHPFDEVLHSSESSDMKLQHSKTTNLQTNHGETAHMPQKSRKLVTAEKSVERTQAKLDKAKDKLPSKKKRSSQLVFDEETGRSRHELVTEKQVKSQSQYIKGSLPLRPIKAGLNSALNFGHSKIFQVEHENVEIKAAHRGEMVVEDGVRSALRYRKSRRYAKVAKLEHKLAKKNINLSYRQALEKNPKLRSNIFSRMWQKRKIKKQYAQAARETKRAAGGVKRAGAFAVRVAKFVVRVKQRSPKALAILLVAGLAVSMVMSIFSFGMSLGGGGMGFIFATSHLSDEVDISNASLAYSEWEVELLTRIANIQSEVPNFDEYRFSVDMVDHNPL